MAESMFNKPDGVSLQTINKKLVTFAFTRHPFQRLVSAYNGNFVDKGQSRFIGSSGPMNFAEYVIRNILEYHMKYGPDFKNHNGYNAHTLHFIPQYLACPHCKLEFDLVGKLEDMERHTAFLAQHLGLEVTRIICFMYLITYIL